MKTAVICIFCELCTIAGIVCALVYGAELSEILVGILLMLAASLLLVRTKEGS